MRALILSLVLLFSTTVYAGFLEGMVVGSLLTPSKKQVVQVHKDEFTTQVEAIENRLWDHKYRTVSPTISFDVPKKDLESYVSYFKNKGESFSVKENTLVFDFSNSYVLYLEREKERQAENLKWQERWATAKSYWWVALLVFIGIAFIHESLNPSPSTVLLLKLQKQIILNLRRSSQRK